MADQDFRDRILETLSRMESQAKENNERLEKRIEDAASQAKEDNERLEKRLDAMDNRMGVLERDVGWIKENWKVNRKAAAEC